MAKNLENDDDWLFRSIQDYSSLHMYELQHPTACLQCLSPSTVGIATQQDNGESELMELCLPGKLMAEGPDEALCNDRDFKVISGGFHDSHITQLAHSKENSCVVCVDKGNAITVWKLGDKGSDLLKKSHSIQPNTHVSSCTIESKLAVSDTKCIYGPRVDQLFLADIQIGKNIHTYDCGAHQSHYLISNIHVVDGSTAVICTRDGDLLRLDTRTKNAPTEIHKTPASSQNWTCCRDDDDGGVNVFMLSSDGVIKQVEFKNPKTEKQSWTTGLESITGEFMQIKKSPTSEGLISVSGLDHNVHVYDLKVASGPLSPRFTHIGHWAEAADSDAPDADTDSPPRRPMVLGHTWHPEIPRLLLSAAEDGSLHAWQYVINSS